MEDKFIWKDFKWDELANKISSAVNHVCEEFKKSRSVFNEEAINKRLDELHKENAEARRLFWLKQPKPRQPLFTDESGIPIYENEMYWLVELSTHRVCASIGMAGATKHECQKYFSTETAARSYIENNNPILSFNDVVKCIDIGSI